MINGRLLHQSNIFAAVLANQIYLEILSVVQNIYQNKKKRNFNHMYVFQYAHLKRFVSNMIIFRLRAEY